MESIRAEYESLTEIRDVAKVCEDLDRVRAVHKQASAGLKELMCTEGALGDDEGSQMIQHLHALVHHAEAVATGLHAIAYGAENPAQRNEALRELRVHLASNKSAENRPVLPRDRNRVIRDRDMTVAFEIAQEDEESDVTEEDEEIERDPNWEELLVRYRSSTQDFITDALELTEILIDHNKGEAVVRSEFSSKKGPLIVKHWEVLWHIQESCWAWRDLREVNCDEGCNIVTAKVFFYLSVYDGIIWRNGNSTEKTLMCIELIKEMIEHHFGVAVRKDLFYKRPWNTAEGTVVHKCYQMSHNVRRVAETTASQKLLGISAIVNFIGDCEAIKTIYKQLFPQEGCIILPLCQYFLLCYAAKLSHHEDFTQDAEYKRVTEAVRALVANVVESNSLAPSKSNLPKYFHGDDDDVALKMKENMTAIISAKKRYEKRGRSVKSALKNKTWLNPAYEFLKELEAQLKGKNADGDEGSIIGVHGSIPNAKGAEIADIDVAIGVLNSEGNKGRYDQRERAFYILEATVEAHNQKVRQEQKKQRVYLATLISSHNNEESIHRSLENPVVPLQVVIGDATKTQIRLDVMVGAALAQSALSRWDFMTYAMPGNNNNASTDEKAWCKKIKVALNNTGINGVKKSRDFASALKAIWSVLRSAQEKKDKQILQAETKSAFLYYLFGQRGWMKTIHNCGVWMNPGADPLSMMSHVSFDVWSFVGEERKPALFAVKTYVDQLFKGKRPGKQEVVNRV